MNRSASNNSIGLTVRIVGRSGTASLDDGASMKLPTEETAGLVDQLSALSNLVIPGDRAGMTAAAQSSLAEARHALPNGRHQSLPDDRPSLFRSLAKDDSDEMVAVTDLGPSRPFAEVLASRTSIRKLGPVDVGLVGTVMARAALTRRSWTSQDGYPESSRPAPSAGARHPHFLVLLAQQVYGLRSGSWLLDPDCASLRPGHHSPTTVVRALAGVTDALRLTEPPPAVIFSVARPSLILDRYPTGISLLWRDAGALLALLHLAATDLDLGSCIVGTSGVLHPNEGDASAPVDTGAIAIGTLR